MTLIHAYNGSDIAGVVPLADEKSFAARAEIGQAETIGVVVDDSGASRDFVGFKSWAIRETACTAGNVYAWHGYVGVQEVARKAGTEAAEFAGAARVWDLDLTEDNGYPGRIKLRGTDCKRPAESVDTRLAWWLTKTGITGIIADHGNVASSSEQCDAVDYTGRFAADVLRDLSLVSGFNHYLRYREASSDLELFFYDSVTSTLDDVRTTFKISNDPADVDYAVTWPTAMDARLRRDPQRVAGGVLVQYTGGQYYLNAPSTESTFGLVDQDAPSANVIKTKDAASRLAVHFLEQHDEQDERVVSVRVRLPAANLNDIRQGQLTEARFTHLPGWETSRACRVAYRSFSRPENRTQAFYDVDLELAPAEPVTAQHAHARLERPNDEAWEGSGDLDMQLYWSTDGDNPAGGDPNDPLVGLIEYYPDPKPAHGWEALRVLGDGTGDISLNFNAIYGCDGDVTCTAYIEVNGVSVGSSVFTSSGGLRFDNPGFDFTVSDVAVVSGDIITGRVIGTGNIVGGITVPSGVGSGGHLLMFDGDLTP